jgi:hypothetical protein
MRIPQRPTALQGGRAGLAAGHGRIGAHLNRRFRLVSQIVKLKSFSKFENTAEALQAAANLVESKLSKGERVVVHSPACFPAARCDA